MDKGREYNGVNNCFYNIYTFYYQCLCIYYFIVFIVLFYYFIVFIVFAGCEREEGSVDGKVQDCQFRQPMGIFTESERVIYTI